MYKPNHKIENERADKMRRGTWTEQDEHIYLKQTMDIDLDKREAENYDESFAAAANEINTQFHPDLQNKIDAEQAKVNNDRDDAPRYIPDNDKIIVDFDTKGTPIIRGGGMQSGNVNIKWEPDQKCIKPIVTVNEFATKDQILQAVRNAEYAYMACKDSIETISQVCAPLPIPEPKKKKQEQEEQEEPTITKEQYECDHMFVETDGGKIMCLSCKKVIDR